MMMFQKVPKTFRKFYSFMLKCKTFPESAAWNAFETPETLSFQSYLVVLGIDGTERFRWLEEILQENHVDQIFLVLYMKKPPWSMVNLVRTNTCFKRSVSCIDLILPSRKYSFKNTTSYETGLSDHHHMILTMLKTTFQQKEPKCLIYRDYKNFNFENF